LFLGAAGWIVFKRYEAVRRRVPVVS
jgi:hypothetical protein